jgi:hypothetical protein
LQDYNSFGPVKCRRCSVVQDKISDLDSFRGSFDLVGGGESFDSDSYKLIGGHDQLKRLSRCPSLMKLVAITGRSYFVDSRTILAHKQTMIRQVLKQFAQRNRMQLISIL